MKKLLSDLKVFVDSLDGGKRVRYDDVTERVAHLYSDGTRLMGTDRFAVIQLDMELSEGYYNLKGERVNVYGDYPVDALDRNFTMRNVWDVSIHLNQEEMKQWEKDFNAIASLAKKFKKPERGSKPVVRIKAYAKPYNRKEEAAQGGQENVVLVEGQLWDAHLNYHTMKYTLPGRIERSYSHMSILDFNPEYLFRALKVLNKHGATEGTITLHTLDNKFAVIIQTDVGRALILGMKQR